MLSVYFVIIYSQTWANDHLRIATTCLQRPLFWGPILNFYSINDLWTTTTCQQPPLFFGSQGWSLYTGLTVHRFLMSVWWNKSSNYFNIKTLWKSKGNSKVDSSIIDITTIQCDLCLYLITYWFVEIIFAWF